MIGWVDTRSSFRDEHFIDSIAVSGSPLYRGASPDASGLGLEAVGLAGRGCGLGGAAARSIPRLASSPCPAGGSVDPSLSRLPSSSFAALQVNKPRLACKGSKGTRIVQAQLSVRRAGYHQPRQYTCRADLADQLCAPSRAAPRDNAKRGVFCMPRVRNSGPFGVSGAFPPFSAINER